MFKQLFSRDPKKYGLLLNFVPFLIVLIIGIVASLLVMLRMNGGTSSKNKGPLPEQTFFAAPVTPSSTSIKNEDEEQDKNEKEESGWLQYNLQEHRRILNTMSHVILNAPITKDGRLLISRDDLETFWDQDLAPVEPIPEESSWNESSPTEWITYENPKFGILSMQLPYNPAWGNKRIAITPYFENTGGDDEYPLSLHFGNVGYLQRWEGGSLWPSEYALTISPRLSPEQLKDRFMSGWAENADDLDIHTETINEHSLVTINSSNELFGGRDTLYILIGTKYNYWFSSFDQRPNGDPFLLSIISQMKVE